MGGGGRREGKERRPGLWLQLSRAFRDEGSWAGCRLSRCSAKSTARLPKKPRQSWGVWTPSPSPGAMSGHPPSLHLDASPSISRSYGGAVKGHVPTREDPVVGAVPSAARCLQPSGPGSPLPTCASRLPAPGGNTSAPGSAESVHHALATQARVLAKPLSFAVARGADSSQVHPKEE